MLEIGGIALLPEWPLFLSFVAAGLALNLVPGADMAFVVASAARGGRRDGVTAALGIGAGALVHVLAAVLGLSAVLASSPWLFDAIKWLGALYLLWLAIGLLKPAEAPPHEAGTQSRGSGRRLFRAAMLVSVLNPKVAIFFLAFLPQFVDPAAAMPALQILCLGLWFDLVGTLVNIVVALAAANAAARLRHVGWLGRVARWLGATVLGALAVQLALTARRQA